jgi:hypothetical protein
MKKRMYEVYDNDTEKTIFIRAYCEEEVFYKLNLKFKIVKDPTVFNREEFAIYNKRFKVFLFR